MLRVVGTGSRRVASAPPRRASAPRCRNATSSEGIECAAFSRTFFSLATKSAAEKRSSASSVTATQKPKAGEVSPFRYPVAWQDADFYDEKKLEEESRRIFEVCHGCRRCFNLCNSFPKLFELIDQTPGGALEEVPSKKFKSVADDCTLCDMCFITKCPYTPPHEFNIDFPTLMLRYRAVERGLPMSMKIKPMSVAKVAIDAPQKLPPFKYPPEPVASGVDRSLQLRAYPIDHTPRFFTDLYTSTDVVGPLASLTSSFANWATKPGPQRLTRRMLEWLLGISSKADLPQYVPRSETLPHAVDEDEAFDEPNEKGPSFGKRKAFLFATCLVTYNKPTIGKDALAVLLKNGVDVDTEHLMCCGMPQLESGNIAEVVMKAKDITSQLVEVINDGADIVSAIPSCTFMLKHQWPLLLPENKDVKKVAERTFDLSEYIVDISKKEGLLQPLQPLDENVTLQHACHARAQNMGFKSKEMLSLIPGLTVTALERCSGHGGSFGVRKETHDIAVNVGKPAAQSVLRDHKRAKGEETEVKARVRRPIVKSFGGHPVGHKPPSSAPAPSSPSPSYSLSPLPTIFPPSTAPPSPPLPSSSLADNTASTDSTQKPAIPRLVRPHSVSSDCPLAADHLAQIVRDTNSVHVPTLHPIQLLARSMQVSTTVNPLPAGRRYVHERRKLKS